MANILLIEPDTPLAKIYHQTFASVGHEAKIARGAQAAVSLADSQTPDLVVMEIQLPGHNGLEFLYEFRSYPDWQAIPVLINSLVPPSEFSGSSMLWQQLGVSEYLYKPTASLWQLLHVVETHLQLAAKLTDV